MVLSNQLPETATLASRSKPPSRPVATTQLEAHHCLPIEDLQRESTKVYLNTALLHAPEMRLGGANQMQPACCEQVRSPRPRHECAWPVLSIGCKVLWRKRTKRTAA